MGERRQLIPENEQTRRDAEALERYGEQASGQAPTNMFSDENRKPGRQFKKAPNSSYWEKMIKRTFGIE